MVWRFGVVPSALVSVSVYEVRPVVASFFILIASWVPKVPKCKYPVPSSSTKNAGSMVSIWVCDVVSSGLPMASFHGPSGLFDLATPMANGSCPAASEALSFTGT